MPVPIPEGEAHALRQCLTILGRHATPSERQTMASNTNRRISGADTSTLTFSFRQVSLLFYPANDGEARRLENLMRRARDANTLTCSLPIERGGITFSDLAVWPDCPAVPQDSPLRYWLPSRPEETLGTGCEEIGERQPIEPPLAVAPLAGTEAPLPLGTPEDLLQILGGKQLDKAFPHHVAETQGLMLKPDHELIADGFLRLEHDGREFSSEEARTLLWTPRPADEPALPFPFDARQLAAFMVFGAGQEIAHLWPDDDTADKLEGRSFESPTAAFRLLHEAHRLLAEAEGHFPFPDEGFTWQTINDRARWLLAASVPDAYLQAELSSERARFWLSMDCWTREEAGLLLFGIDPYLAQEAAHAHGGQWDTQFPEGMPLVADLLGRAEQSGVLNFPARPRDIIDWSMSKSLRLPGALIPVGYVPQGGNWVSPARVHLSGSESDAATGQTTRLSEVAPQAPTADAVTDYVATIHVLAGQTVWPADEVPHLTADALYRCEPDPDPVVTRAELRRFTSADLTNRAAGRLLNDRELSQFASKCKAVGLPELTDGLRYRQWGEYLEVFNQDAESRGWWAGLIPPRDPHHTESLSWAIAAEEHRKLLKATIASGEVHAHMVGTLMPAAPGLVGLQSLVLTREGLESFANLLAMRVVAMPHFVTGAWPLKVPPELQALPADARISYEHSFAGQRGSGTCRASEYRAEVEARIARQAERFFTLNEAAQVLAECRPGLFAETCVRDWLEAHAAGTLPIHQGESRFPIQAGTLVRDFFDLVETRELDAWLRAKAMLGFPPAAFTTGTQDADFSNAVLRADFWFQQSTVSPEHAAMLLRHINPAEADAQERAERDTAHDGERRLGPIEFAMLRLAFEDAEKQSGPRNLLGWLEVARQRGLVYHSWIDEYLRANSLLPETAETKSVPQATASGPARVSGKAKRLELPAEPVQKRARLLELFRELGGKRANEGGKAGTRGALTRLVEATGIDKDTLGAMLDKAIHEKRAIDSFAQLTAKR
jgi:hypothetical protein